ncbi:MAG: S-layer homology domain-containing protein [Candidatus Pristimantibacillus sp.]
MKFKFLTTAFILFAIPLFLTGCIYANITVDISADGSGKSKLVGGYSKEILDKIGKTPKDFSSKNNEYYELTYGGKKYLAETWEDAFSSPENMHLSVVDNLENSMGPVELVKTTTGFQLYLGLFDNLGPNMKTDRILPKLKDITEKSLEGMKLVDLIAQDADGLVLKATFNMPYNVKQIAGDTTGVVVKGKTISLDYLKMIDSGSKEWKFESSNPDIDKNNPFSDVKDNAWYAAPINTVANAGILNGFTDGKFRPNNNLTLGELSKIIAVVLGYDIPNNPEYWAKGHVLFAQDNGFVLSKAEATANNWEISATREQVVYAITLATGFQEATGNITSKDVKGWDNIDSRMQSTILAVYNVGIVKGNPNGSFNAKSKITRAEIAQILYNILETNSQSHLKSAR